MPGTDADGDSVASLGTGGGDCNDDDPAINPGVDELDYPEEYGVDHNCDPEDDWDHDKDGYNMDRIEGGTDCDDENAYVNPGVEEISGDEIDNNCDGCVDTWLPEECK